MSKTKKPSGRFLKPLLILSIVGSILSAWIFGMGLMASFPFAAILVILFNVGKILSVFSLLANRAQGLWAWLICELGFVASWFTGYYLQQLRVEEELSRMPEALARLMAKGGTTLPWKEPWIALACMMILSIAWYFLIRNQWRKFQKST